MVFSTIWLLVIVLLGTYIQTLTGFGFGLIVMGIAGALELMPIADLAFIASVLSLVNGLSGLYGGVWRLAQFRNMLVFMMLALPMVWVGLISLEHLGNAAISVLQGLLGIVMILVCLMSFLKPAPLDSPSPKWHFAIIGAFAGLLSGLFSTAGPPISYLMYRQPVALNVIRATLLSIFLLLAAFRTTLSTVAGWVDPSIWWTCLIGAPLVVLGTTLSRSYLLNLIEAKTVKKVAMLMLMASGMSLLWRALVSAV